MTQIQCKRKKYHDQGTTIRKLLLTFDPSTELRISVSDVLHVVALAAGVPLSEVDIFVLYAHLGLLHDHEDNK
jgi:hypothetical protein